MEKKDFGISNVVFDYGGVLVQYDFVAFFGRLLGSRERGQWFMSHVLPEEIGAAMDRELHPFDYYIRQQQEQWPEYADALSYFASHYTDVFTVETPGIRDLILLLKDRGYHVYGLSNWSSKISEVKEKYSVFGLITEELVSKDVHLLKPDPAIYRAFLDKFHLEAKSCLFLDDKSENISGCEKVGMRGLRFDREHPDHTILAVKNLLLNNG